MKHSVFALSTFLAACQTASSFVPGAAPRPIATILCSTQPMQKQSKTVNPTLYKGNQKGELDQATKGVQPSSLIPDVLFPVNEAFIKESTFYLGILPKDTASLVTLL